MINIFDILVVKIERFFYRHAFKRVTNELRHIFMNKATACFSTIAKAYKHVFGLFVIANLEVHVSKVVNFKLINSFLHF